MDSFEPEKERTQALEKIGKILPAALRDQLRHSEAPLLDLLTPLWPRLVGKGIARQCRPVSFFGGTLTVATSCPTWAAQLRQFSEQIRAEVNRYLGSDLVKKLRVRQDSSVAPAEFSTGKAIAPEPAALDGPDAAKTLHPDVAGVLQRSYAKYFARGMRKVH